MTLKRKYDIQQFKLTEYLSDDISHCSISPAKVSMTSGFSFLSARMGILSGGRKATPPRNDVLDPTWQLLHTSLVLSGLGLRFHSANERRRYKVTPFLIAWAQICNQPYIIHLWRCLWNNYLYFVTLPWLYIAGNIPITASTTFRQNESSPKMYGELNKLK